MQLHTDTARWLLAHLNDNPALSSAELLGGFPTLQHTEPHSRADALRAVVLDSIEFLRPARSSTIRSPEARSYAVLWLRYVEGMTVEEVSEEVALSERQVHRELRVAEAKLAVILPAHMASLASATGPAPTADVEDGAVSVEVRPAQIRLTEAVQAAIDTIAPLARGLGRTVTLQADLADDRLFADEGVMRQLLIQMLSLVLQNSATADIAVTVLDASDRCSEVGVGPIERIGIVNPRAVDELEQLARALHLSLLVEDNAGALSVTLRIALHQPKTVLVIEDSPAAVELYRRYLEPGGDWRVVGVSEPKLAYDSARSLQPAIIVLDLLMPGTDGWTVLNLLRAQEETAEIPVVVCSVFQDPLLAEALGARAHLRKPVSRAQLLSAMRRWAR